MKLLSGTALLGKTLAHLGHLASKSHGVSAPLILNRIHVKWTGNDVVLTASDGHRMCSVTLPGVEAGEKGESTLAISPEPWSAGMQLHTIFRETTGDVKVIGDREVGVGISRTRTEMEAFGVNLGHVEEAYPIGVVEDMREKLSTGFASDKNKVGERRIQVNPIYMNEALNMIHMLWFESKSEEPPHVNMVIPNDPHAPMWFVSHWEKKKPLFNVEFLIMPYRTP